MRVAAFPLLALLAGCGDFGLVELAADTSGGGRIETDPADDVQFDDAVPDDHAKTTPVVLISSGDGAVAVQDVWVDSNTDGVFYTNDDLPFPKTLAPDHEVTVNLHFLPTAVGTFHGTLNIEIGDDGTVLQRALTGKGCRDDDDDRQCD